MVDQTLLYLSKEDVEKVGITMEEIIEILEKVYVLKSEDKVEMPPKPGIHPSGDAFIHAMPAYIPDLKAAGIKWVSGYPQNTEKGLPYISGLIILNDPETGFPVAVMDAVWITAKRTGAATAIAAKHLARADSRTIGIIGCGVQGRSNLEALMVVQKKIKSVITYDINKEKAEMYIKEMHPVFPKLEFINVKTPKEVVAESDIVVTAAPILKHPNPVIEADWFKEGTFASPVDFDSYWKPSAMALVDKFCTDDRNQIAYYKKLGYFKKIPEIYADLGELVSGKKPGRENKKERTMAVNLGLALNDVSTGIVIYNRAKEKGIGLELPLKLF